MIQRSLRRSIHHRRGQIHPLARLPHPRQFRHVPDSSIASPAASSRPRLHPRVAGHVLESPDASSRSRLHPPVAGHALASSWPHPRIRGHIRTSPVHVVDVKHQPAPISMASSSWGSSFEPQLFPKNLFKLAVDLTHPTRQIFDSAREGNIGSMKRLTELREKEGKSVVVVEEIKDSQNRRRGGLLREAGDVRVPDQGSQPRRQRVCSAWTAKWTQWGARVRRG